MKHNYRRIKLLSMKGFTLIELAVVLVIVGILLGGFISTFAERIDTTRYVNAEEQLEKIKQVLMAYAFSRGGVAFLPCPDTDDPADGFENRDGAGACTPAGDVGLLPWRTLGFGYEDAWGAHYAYWVSAVYSVNSGFLLASADSGGGSGNSAIQTREGDVSINVATNAVAVIFSHGKNGLGAISVNGVDQEPIPVAGHDDENENVDSDFIFMSHPPIKEGAAAIGGAFDDVLIWINSYEIKAKMVETGVLP